MEHSTTGKTWSSRRSKVLTLVVGILVASGTRSTALANDGALDLTFGTGGKVIKDFNNRENILWDMAVQADGKTIVIGDGQVARFDASGTLDATFGPAGTGLVDMSTWGFDAECVTVQADGAIVLGGDASLTDVAVARLDANGALDPSFGTSGIATLDLGTTSERTIGIAVRDDGTIVGAGVTLRLVPPFGADQDIAVYRLHADGSPDLSFNQVGFAITALTPLSENTTGVVLQPDGKVVVAGASILGYVLIRYDEDGTYDTSFGGGDGIVTQHAPPSNGYDTATGVALQPDGKIVVATHAASGFFVARHLPDGTLDPAFDGDGFSSAMTGIEEGLVVHEDGRILVLATVAGNLGVARFTTDGVLDATFGTAGVATVDFQARDQATVIRALPDGRLMLGGRTQGPFLSPPFNDWALARLEAPSPHAVTFFLQGDAPQTSAMAAASAASGVQVLDLTMSLTASSVQTVSVFLPDGVQWTSDAPLTGVFLANAAFELHLPCTASLAPTKTIQVFALSADGQTARELARGTHKGTCAGPVTITLPVTTTGTQHVFGQALRVALSGAASTSIDIETGPGAFLTASGFVGTP